MTNELQQVADYMANLRWTRDVNFLGEVSYVRPDYDYCVKLHGDHWELCDFSDGDVSFEGHTEAVGRFETMEAGETLMELIDALQKCRRMPPPAPVRQAAETYAEIANGIYVRMEAKRISRHADRIDAAYDRWRDRNV